MAQGVADGNPFPTRSRLSIQRRRPVADTFGVFQPTDVCDGVDRKSTPERHFLAGLCAFS